MGGRHRRSHDSGHGHSNDSGHGHSDDSSHDSGHGHSHRRSHDRSQGGTKPPRRWGRVALLVATTACALGLVAGVGLVAAAARGLPSWRTPGLSGERTSVIYDIHGRKVAPVPGTVDRLPLKNLGQAPRYVPQAFIAVEDRRFYSEPGISPLGILRAAWENLIHRRIVQGGSTITQQLARRAFPIGDRRTLRRKIREALLAIELNQHYTKDQILTMYLNDVYFGEHAIGIRAASQTYFGHDVRDDTVAQAALLAGLVQAPSAYDPYVNPRLALARRDTVLDKMAQQGYIDAAQARAAKSETLAQMGLRPAPRLRAGAQAYPYPWYVDATVETLIGKLHLSEAEVYRGGLSIYTSLDPRVQSAAQKAIGFLDGRFPADAKPPLQVGLAVVQQRTGDVVALVGGRTHTRQLQFDRATQAERQPGSAIKPLAVYVPALESGMTAATVVDDAPVGYPDGHGGLWVPQNDSHRYEGLTTLREAVRRSVNVVAVKTLDRVGIERGYRTARRMGLVDLRPADRHLSLALGGTTHCCTPLEMADAYATIADGGVHRAPVIVRKVEDAGGRVIYRADPHPARVVSPQVAYVMTDILESVVEPQPAGGWDENRGTAPRAAVPGWPTAGKTGTTTGGRDAWFAGFTPRYTAAVWLGYDQPRGVPDFFGGTYAAPIFERVMRSALAGDRPAPFSEPHGIVSEPVDAKSGLLPGPLTPHRWVRQEVFVAGTQPRSISQAWVRRQVVQVPPAAGARAQGAATAGQSPDARAGRPEPALWDPGCPLPPRTRVFLDRKPVTAADVAAYAAADHVGAASMIPADMALAAPTQTCTQALGIPGGGPSAPGGPPPGAAAPGTPGAAGPSLSGGVLTWHVTLSQAAPPSPGTIEARLGAPLRIVFTAASGHHHVLIPALGVVLSVAPGGTATVDLTPRRAGSFTIIDSLHLTRPGRLVVTAAGPAAPS